MGMSQMDYCEISICTEDSPDFQIVTVVDGFLSLTSLDPDDNGVEFNHQNDNVNRSLPKKSKEMPGQLSFAVDVVEGTYSINNSNQNVITYVALTIDDQITVPKRITYYDMQVLDAVSSVFLWYEQHAPEAAVIVDDATIWRVLNGKNLHSRPTKKQIARIRASMTRLRTSLLYMNVTAEVNAGMLEGYKRNPDGDVIINTNIIHADECVITKRSRNKEEIEIAAYRILARPSLLRYNQAKQHLVFYPAELLDVGSSRSNSAEIRNFLLDQINWMKYPDPKLRRKSKVILFKRMYEAGIDAPADRSRNANTVRSMRQRDLDTIKDCLDAWTTLGFINGFKFKYDKNNQATGVIIDADPSEKQE